MSKGLKFLAGLSAALAVGLASHGPLGRGEALIDDLDASLRRVVAEAEIPGLTGRMQREPLARTAILSGPTNRFQREGQGSLPGLDEQVLAVRGIARVEWTNPPS